MTSQPDEQQTDQQLEQQIIDAGMGRIRFSSPDEADRCIDRLFAELKRRQESTK